MPSCCSLLHHWGRCLIPLLGSTYQWFWFSGVRCCGSDVVPPSCLSRCDPFIEFVQASKTQYSQPVENFKNFESFTAWALFPDQPQVSQLKHNHFDAGQE